MATSACTIIHDGGVMWEDQNILCYGAHLVEQPSRGHLHGTPSAFNRYVNMFLFYQTFGLS